MKSLGISVAVGCLLTLLAGSVLAADQQAKKLTCCQEAAVKGKDCSHRCCIAAHKEKLSCIKCNPNKEDLKLKKKAVKAEAIK